MPLIDQSPGECANGNGSATRFAVDAPEDFRTFAWAEMVAAPPWVRGTCFNPACGRAFNPARGWQVFCGRHCADAVGRNLRRWGNMAALPLLLHRAHKYAAQDTPEADLARAARRHVTQVQSAMWGDWQAKARAR